MKKLFASLLAVVLFCSCVALGDEAEAWMTAPVITKAYVATA